MTLQSRAVIVLPTFFCQQVLLLCNISLCMVLCWVYIKQGWVRTDYEVDFITYFTRLCGTKMGAKFDDIAYLQPIQMDIPKL